MQLALRDQQQYLGQSRWLQQLRISTADLRWMYLPKKNHCAIFNMKAAKEVSAAILAGESVGFYSEFPSGQGQLPMSDDRVWTLRKIQV